MSNDFYEEYNKGYSDKKVNNKNKKEIISSLENIKNKIINIIENNDPNVVMIIKNENEIDIKFKNDNKTFTQEESEKINEEFAKKFEWINDINNDNILDKNYEKLIKNLNKNKKERLDSYKNEIKKLDNYINEQINKNNVQDNIDLDENNINSNSYSPIINDNNNNIENNNDDNQILQHTKLKSSNKKSNLIKKQNEINSSDNNKNTNKQIYEFDFDLKEDDKSNKLLHKPQKSIQEKSINNNNLKNSENVNSYNDSINASSNNKNIYANVSTSNNNLIPTNINKKSISTGNEHFIDNDMEKFYDSNEMSKLDKIKSCCECFIY